MSRILLLTALMAAHPAPAAGKRHDAIWVPVATGGQRGAGEVYFVDRAGLRRAAAGIEALIMQIRERPTRSGVVKSVERARVDCERRGSVALFTSFHAADGRLLKTAASDGTFEHYDEGTSWRIVIDTICDGSLPAATEIDPDRYANAYFARQF